jgi:hypothetical protein
MITRIACAVSVLVLVAGETAEWVNFEPKGGGFAAAFPSKPAEKKQSVKTATGSFVDVSLFVAEPKRGEGQFVISYSEFSDAQLKGGTDEKRLENARNGAAISIKGKVRGEKKIALDKHPGLEFIIDTDKTVVRTRIYAVKKRMYQAMVVGPKAVAEGKDAQRFLDSFKLLK